MSELRLARADAVYGRLAAHAAAAPDPEAALERVEAAARVACFAHTGRYADGALEALATGALPPEDIARVPAAGSGARRRVLHVATTLLELGGHTRLLANWVRNDTASEHSLVLTAQGADDVPPWVPDAITASGGSVERLRGQPTSRARQLRARADEASLVLLHIHQFDPVPLAALAHSRAPVALINHADHMFWIGTSVADVVVSLRDRAERLTMARRMPLRTAVVPIPLAVPADAPDRVAARGILGIPDGETALVSIGSHYKYVPDGAHDFFASSCAILASNPDARMYVVGTTSGEAAPYLAGQADAGRLRFVGPQPDPLLYQRAADIYLDGTPVGSYTALLDSALAGALPVFGHDPIPLLDVYDDPGLSHLPLPARGVRDYVAYVSALLRDLPGTRALARETAAAVSRHHVGECWRTRVEALYSDLARAGHRPRTLPRSHSERTSDDAERAGWDEVLWGDRPVAAFAAPAARGAAHFAGLLRLSVAAGDTRLTPRHARSWLGEFRRALRRAR